MSKLKEEELLDWFVNYINTRAIPLDYMKKLQQIVELIKKPKVTEQWIEAKAGEMIVMILHGMKKDAIAFIRSLLKEAK